MSKIRETDEGKENNRNISAKIRSTDEGKEKHRLGIFKNLELKKRITL